MSPATAPRRPPWRGPRPRRGLATLLVLLPAAGAATRILRGGIATLSYDECEYARQMLGTADRVFEQGLLSWPSIVAFHQEYMKPPLLVDLAAGATLLVGRDEPARAIALTMAAIAALSSLVIFRLVGALFSTRTAVAALLALGAIPAGALFAARLFPEPLVTALLALLLALLFAPRHGWPPGRTLALGLVLGLGLLTKTTFAVLAAGPLLVAWLRGDAGGPGGRGALRWGLIGGLMLGLLAASLWYARNLGPALQYAQEAYGWASWAPRSGAEVAAAWGEVISRQALGLGGIALVLLAAALAIVRPARRRRPGARRSWGRSTPIPAERSAPTSGHGSVEPSPRGSSAAGSGRSPAERSAQRTLLLALLAAAVPSIAMALPSANVAARLLLPALSCLAVAAAIVVAEGSVPARPAGAAVGAPAKGPLRWLRGAVLGLVSVQFLAVQAGAFASVQASAIDPPLREVVRLLSPGFGPLDHFDTRPLETLLRTTAATARFTPPPERPVLYFVDNFPELDVARFQLYQARREAAVPTRWLCYFDWSEEERARALAQARAGRSLVVLYRPSRPLRSDLAFLNRHGDACRQALAAPGSGFRKVRDLSPPGAAYTLELHANFPFAPRRASPSSGPPPGPARSRAPAGAPPRFPPW